MEKKQESDATALPRATKQIISVAMDSVGISAGVIVSIWPIGDSFASTALSQVCPLAVLIALPIARSQGLFQSIVMSIRLGLYYAAYQTSFGSVYSTSLLAPELLIAKAGATRALLAVPSAGRQKRRKNLERLSVHLARVQSMPNLHDLISEKTKIDDSKDVIVEDPLGCNPVSSDDELLRASI